MSQGGELAPWKSQPATPTVGPLGIAVGSLGYEEKVTYSLWVPLKIWIKKEGKQKQAPWFFQKSGWVGVRNTDWAFIIRKSKMHHDSRLLKYHKWKIPHPKLYCVQNYFKIRGNLPSTDVCNVYMDFVFRFWSFKIFHFICAKILISDGGGGEPWNLNTGDPKHFGKSVLAALVLPWGSTDDRSILPLPARRLPGV